MSNIVTNPIHWTAERLISYGHDVIHDLALNAAGTLNSYHLVLGRCLLAVHRTKLYEVFACSGAVHYATQVLGIRVSKARALRRVAQALEALPQLSRAGEAGEVDWSKLREVVRRATLETEGFWLELCRHKTYRQIEKLVRYTPEGAIPGDLPSEGDKEPAVTDLRIQLGPTARAIVERGLQAYSLKQGRPVALAEAMEFLFAQLLQKDGIVGPKGRPATDLGQLAKGQEEARKDLLAASLRKDPLVQEARELARAMGVTATRDGASESDTTIDTVGSAALTDSNDAALPLSHIYRVLHGGGEPIEILVDDDPTEAVEQPARENSAASSGDRQPTRNSAAVSANGEQPAGKNSAAAWAVGEQPARQNSGASSDEEQPARNTCNDDLNETSAPTWEQTLAAHHVPCPGNDRVSLIAKDWRNPRLRFNPETRMPTAAQRREMLRRDGYCCNTPGCPNHLWLEVHHVMFYSRKGGTISSNLVTLCSRCHKNVHNGHLRLSGQAPDKLIYKDRHGNDLARLHATGVAGWLDFWLGWSGRLEDSHQHRLARGSGP